MFVLSSNFVWLDKILISFFYSIDKTIYNFIPLLYNLLISISRTTILTQGQISVFANRIYLLLGIFMLFKVTFSLITYVVNPDDFTDKSKGFASLGKNVIISLCLLILVPYIFDMAYNLQSIILEDNVIGTVILGQPNDENDLSDAGNQMAYSIISAFFAPNSSIDELTKCTNYVKNVDGRLKINEECFGIQSGTYSVLSNNVGFAAIENMDKIALANYAAGIENSNIGLFFRKDIAVITDDNNNFVINYEYPFSTVVGVIVCLLLVTFCIDIGLRSVKLSFLQLIYPIPVISYIDPKSGKDGLFKKWYKMCFSTFLSLFLRLAALYFAIYLISNVSGLTDVVTGASVNDSLVQIFIIIGLLIFAKQLPKLLEELGLKIKGEGFTLNPIKKVEKEALGGKAITGLARGTMVGAVGAVTGAGVGRLFSGAWRGLTSNKGWTETGKQEIEMNRKMRKARMDGSTLPGRVGARISTAVGAPTAAENIDNEIHKIDEKIKNIDNRIKPTQNSIADRKAYTDKVKAMEDRAVNKIKNGEAGIVSEQYLNLTNRTEHLREAMRNNQSITINGQTRMVTEQDVSQAEMRANSYLNTTGMEDYIDFITQGREANIIDLDTGATIGTTAITNQRGENMTDASMTGFYEDLRAMTKVGRSYDTDDQGGRVTVDENTVMNANAHDRHSNAGRVSGSISHDNRKTINPATSKKQEYEQQKAKLYDKQRSTKADESVIK